GNALLEEVVYGEEGQPLATSFMDYLIPTATDVPHVTMDHLETPATVNPLGMKGAGESGTLPVPAVIAAAVENALSARNVFIREVPVSIRRVDELLRSS